MDNLVLGQEPFRDSKELRELLTRQGRRCNIQPRAMGWRAGEWVL
jgi:hypothetical protein